MTTPSDGHPSPGRDLTDQAGAATGATRTLASFGIVSDRTRDQTGAINAAVEQAKAQGIGTILGEAQAVYAHTGPLRLDGIAFDGRGCTLRATSPDQGTVFLSGKGTALRNVRLTGTSTKRGTQLTHCGLVVTASGFSISNVRIDADGTAKGFAGSGAMFFGAHDGSVAGLRVEDTRADGIHVTHGSEDLSFTNCSVFTSGDDGFAVVSYFGDGRTCRNIATKDLVVADAHARGLSIVGGQTIHHLRPRISRSSAAAIYVCSEDSFDTFGVRDWWIRDFTASQCVTGIGLARDFAQPIILLSGRDRPARLGISSSVQDVSDGEIAGHVIGMGDRAACALDSNSAQLNRIRYALKLDHIRGPHAAGYATLLGGRDCSGFIDIQECDGVPFILSARMTGTHSYERLTATDTRMARPRLTDNIHGDGARHFAWLHIDLVGLTDAPGEALGGDIDLKRTSWRQFHFNGQNLPSPARPR